VKPTPPLRLVEALARVARERPVERKLLVAPTFGAGRELLRQLARRGRGWVGFEATTPRPLAVRLARPAMAVDGLQPIDAFDRQALLDEALDGALRSGTDAGLGELSEGVGFREAVHSSVVAIRLAGIAPRQVREARLRDRRKRALVARVLERYEGLLRDRRRADEATILALAIEALGRAAAERRADALGADVVLLMPGLGRRGLSGRFLDDVMAHGAELLDTDPVVGLTAPDALLWREGAPIGELSWLYDPASAPARGPAIELFHAASVTDELREVLRRATAQGAAWDDVEIVAADPAAYGSALHALSTRLRVPVTYAVGLPIERTRPGRVVHAYLDWIEGGFQAAPIRRLLEAGDLVAPRSAGRHAAASLARRFRALRIGWGRRRYRTQLRAALAAVEAAERGPWETPEGFARRAERMRSELEALRLILHPALRATPSVPDRAGEGGEAVSPAEVARGLRAFLRRVPRGRARSPDAAARDEIARVLDRVEATLRRRTGFAAAVTILRRHLEIRVRAPEPEPKGPDDPGAPWTSEGGHLHLSDFEHGGFSGRRAVFVVGLDADRVPGPGLQDPVLSDADRRALGEGLPGSAELLRERSFRLAALMARLRGRVTMSYRAWSAAEARTVSPSPVLLQALRLQRRDPSPTFEELYRTLGDVSCAIPAPDRPALDADDVWMAALEREGLLSEGIGAVRDAFPGLDRGLAAHHERATGMPGPHHGVVTPRPEQLDPRMRADLVLSASRLEDLGACPLRYLYRTVLRLRPPDDPELDPDRWLNPQQRGSLLHAVYEETLRVGKERGVTRSDTALEVLALDALRGALSRAREQIPSPGDGVVQREAAALEEDVRSFVRMVLEHGAPCVTLEMKFGLEGGDPLVLDLDGGELRLRGAIDRVDEDLHGMRVIDYKTGVPRDYEDGTGTFNGGRRLQHAVYARAAERLLGGEDVAGEYHFPTRRGENEIKPFPAADLRPVGALLDRLLDVVAGGGFVPTETSDDCRFCDYAAICRAKDSGWGRIDSPLASWSADQLSLGLHPAFALLRRVRGFED
jgi:ATP-dependent helicase/nuclease subunit B